MNPYLLIFAYGITIVASTMFGGYLPRIVRMNHVRMQMVLSFVGGMMLGVAVLTLLPHGFSSIYRDLQEQSIANELSEVGPMDVSSAANVFSKTAVRSIHATMQAVIVGLLITFFMMRAFHFHQHGDEGHEASHAHEPGHSHEPSSHSHAHSHSHDEHEPRTKLGWVGVGFGLGLHTFMDGIAMGLAVIQDSSMFAGFGVYLAILLHKPLDALSLSTLMGKEKISWGTIQCANACFALMCLAGAFAAVYLKTSVGGFWLGCLLAGSAGVFLCISLSDLLPEVQFHRHDRLQLSAAVVLGIAVALIVECFHQHP